MHANLDLTGRCYLEAALEFIVPAGNRPRFDDGSPFVVMQVREASVLCICCAIYV